MSPWKTNQENMKSEATEGAASFLNSDCKSFWVLESKRMLRIIHPHLSPLWWGFHLVSSFTQFVWTVKLPGNGFTHSPSFQHLTRWQGVLTSAELLFLIAASAAAPLSVHHTSHLLNPWELSPLVLLLVCSFLIWMLRSLASFHIVV